jgi:hypothetical protein
VFVLNLADSVSTGAVFRLMLMIMLGRVQRNSGATLTFSLASFANIENLINLVSPP